MNQLIELTDEKGDRLLVGSEHVVLVWVYPVEPFQDGPRCSFVRTRDGSGHKVRETPEQIYSAFYKVVK